MLPWVTFSIGLFAYKFEFVQTRMCVRTQQNQKSYKSLDLFHHFYNSLRGLSVDLWFYYLCSQNWQHTKKPNFRAGVDFIGLLWGEQDFFWCLFFFSVNAYKCVEWKYTFSFKIQPMFALVMNFLLQWQILYFIFENIYNKSFAQTPAHKNTIICNAYFSLVPKSREINVFF